MNPVIGYSMGGAMCKAVGPSESDHLHECIGPRHGYNEHPCECGYWFKVPTVETREARLPDSARDEGAA